MTRTIVTILFFLITPNVFATTFWCPQDIICGGITTVTCQKGNGEDLWQLDYKGDSNILDSQFHNIGAKYNVPTGLITCLYRNSSSQNLGLIPKSIKLYPGIREGVNWIWDDPAQQQVYCIGHDKCPLSDHPVFAR